MNVSERREFLMHEEDRYFEFPRRDGVESEMANGGTFFGTT